MLGQWWLGLGQNDLFLPRPLDFHVATSVRTDDDGLYSTLHSINSNNAQHPAVQSLPNTHGEVSVAGCPQKSTINGIINTTLIFGTFGPLHLSCVHMERQTIMTTPQQLSSTNHDISY